MNVLITTTSPCSVRTESIVRAVRRLLKEEESLDGEVSILLTNDLAIREMNLNYRGIDRPTDVLSFSQIEMAADAPVLPSNASSPQLGTEMAMNTILGDVVISFDTAERQAKDHGVTLEEELALLATHGVLHLLGYEDETEEGAGRMRARQQKLLGGYGSRY